MYRIESFLSARLFLAPQVIDKRIYFISNLSGRLSLYAMDSGGSIPEPLLPPDIAMQNPHLLEGESFYVYPQLNKILVMLDKDGDENYQPMLIPLDGGYPQTAFNNYFAPYRVHIAACFPDKNLVYYNAESRAEQMQEAYLADLATGEVVKLGESAWGRFPAVFDDEHTRIVLTDGYSMGDHVLYLWEKDKPGNRLLYGTPIEQRQPGQATPLLGFRGGYFTPDGKGMLLANALFDDAFGMGFLNFSSGVIEPVEISGAVHSGKGELTGLERVSGERLLISYNIDGCSWLYEGWFDQPNFLVRLDNVICGQGLLADGVLESCHYDKGGDRYALSFSTATSPTQIFTIEGRKRNKIVQHTRERLLGLPADLLAAGEDASFTSYDGMRISARLYLPNPALQFSGPRPLVYYIHGGPQSQERPDFAWFSMPLIQYLTLNGFAVFVPNVRGSSGYGLSYTKQVDRDWGGNDRLDHVHAMTTILPKDGRLDVTRAGVVGRSYGGYMTLTLSARHPELWKAAVDMFGPYDLLTFMNRIPETWKPYFLMALGDPSKPEEHAFLVERSPRTHMIQLACPMLVIQGKSDPRVVEQESRDLVGNLRASGKQIEYLVFENEGHDVLKHENRVTCYNAITDFFKTHLI